MNEIAKLMGSAVLRISTYAIMADETRDRSNEEQLVLFI